MVALLLLYAAFFAIFTSGAQDDSSGSSDTINLGSGPRSIYRIGYSGEGPVDIDELIEQAQSGQVVGVDDLPNSDEASQTASQLDAPAEPDGAGLSQDAPKEEEVSNRPETAAVQSEDETPPYVRVPVVSDPSGAEVYIDGIFYGVTPFIATVEPESHLVEVYLEGYWNWFNVVDFTESSRTIPVYLTSRQPATLATNESEAAQVVPASKGAQPSAEENESINVTSASSNGNDFWEENYRKLLIVVAVLSFLIGSGSIAAWARSRLTTSIKISFPRDGEDRWAGLVEGQSSRVRGTKRLVYILARRDDDHLRVITRVVPNRDGRWFTRCDVEEGTVYRIYAVVVDRSIDEGAYLDEIPSHRAISEVGPVTGREKRRSLPIGETGDRVGL